MGGWYRAPLASKISLHTSSVIPSTALRNRPVSSSSGTARGAGSRGEAAVATAEELEDLPRIPSEEHDHDEDQEPGAPSDATTVEDVRAGLLMLLGAVDLLLLVACANVAHLFMARGLARAREMSIRRALGARTWNLLGQLSAESASVGAGAGVSRRCEAVS